MREHIESGAQVSISATPVNRSDAADLGILRLDAKNRIDAFLEKPGQQRNIDEYTIPDNKLKETDRRDGKRYLASMGIYIFNAEVLEEVLESSKTDFGKEIIPEAIGNYEVHAYTYRGYWEDIGTMRSFYESNLDLGSPRPRFNLYDQSSPLYTHRRDLPPTKVNSSTLESSIASEGSVIIDARISRSIIGIRSGYRIRCRAGRCVRHGCRFLRQRRSKIS